jgi:uncharacterized protein YggE
MMRQLRIISVAIILVAACGCAAQQQYRQLSSLSENLTITVPNGFNRQSDLSTIIDGAVTDASSQKGVAGNVNVEGRVAGPEAASPAPSGDAYLTALRDGQTHAEEIAKATGLTLGRITSVREQRGLPNYPPYGSSQITLEIDYGTTLTVYGSSPLKRIDNYYGAGNTMTVLIMGQGKDATDARTSTDAFESAIRAALARVGIGPSQIKVQGGSVTAVGGS